MGEKREIGLKAVTGARAERQRSRFGRVTGPVWLLTGGAVVLTVITAWLVSERSLSVAKEELLAQQRAGVVTVGAEWRPLRDRIEAITVEAARAYPGDTVLPEARTWDFRNVPGIYLRLRVDDAKDAETLRKHAKASVKDGFTSCLFRESNPSVAALARGDADAGTANDQPWNLRQAYASTRVLTDEWANEVKDSGDKLRLRVFEQQFDKAKRDEIPLAIDIVKRAQFYLLVLDEDVPEAKDYADAGVITPEALQQVPHPSRVVVVDLKSSKVLVRLRRTGNAGFVFAGERAVTDPEVRAAMKRQVNNCSLAQEVWGAIRTPGETLAP